MARLPALLVGVSALLVGGALLLLTLLLALSPADGGLIAMPDVGSLLTLSHFRTYLARNAILNTLLLSATVLPLGAALAWAWLRLGVARAFRPLLLTPLLLPGPVLGLLWRPLFAPWLELRDPLLAQLSLGLVLLWRITPLLLLLLTLRARAWRMALGLAAALLLLDGGLPLLLTGGAPFNAAHTWASWALQQLWSAGGWAHGAQLFGALALVVGGITWWALAGTPPGSPDPLAVQGARPRWGALLLLLWVAAPFLIPLGTLPAGPRSAWPVSEMLRLIGNGASLTLAAALLALLLAWAWLRLLRRPTQRAALSVALMLLPLWTVGSAYATQQLPALAHLLTLALLVALPTALLTVVHRCADLRAWVGVVLALTLLVQSQSFAWQLVIDLPPAAWTPTVGLVWAFATPSSGQALLLLLHGALALGSAWGVCAMCREGSS